MKTLKELQKFKRVNGNYENEKYRIYELEKNQWVLEAKNSDGEYVYQSEWQTKKTAVEEIEWLERGNDDSSIW